MTPLLADVSERDRRVLHMRFFEDMTQSDIAEQIGEVQDCLAVRNARPVEWLLDHAPVDARWTLVHATHLTGPETAAVAASGLPREDLFLTTKVWIDNLSADLEPAWRVLQGTHDGKPMVAMARVPLVPLIRPE